MTSTPPDTADAVWIGSFGTIYRVPSDATPSGVAVVEHVLGPRRLGAPSIVTAVKTRSPTCSRAS